mgnify:CR=1 FL=1
MKIKKQNKAATPITHAAMTTPYFPRIVDLLQTRKYDNAMVILGDAARDYFARINKATETIPGQDAAILIKLFRHMADELERADPQAAKFVAAMKNINLPPIEYRRQK